MRQWLGLIGTKVSIEELEKIQGLPWGHKETISQEDTGSENFKITETNAESSSRSLPRSFPISMDLLERFGRTPSCPRCTATERGVEKRTVGHSTACRNRLERLIKEDPEYQLLVADAETRKNDHLAGQVEEQMAVDAEAQARETRNSATPPDGPSPSDGNSAGTEGEGDGQGDKRQLQDGEDAATSRTKPRRFPCESKDRQLHTAKSSAFCPWSDP